MSTISERTSLIRNEEGRLSRPGEYEEFGNYNDNIVWWDGDDDPENPMNWGEKKKWSQVAIVAVLTFLV
jgi:hypothetical protein